MFCCCVMEFEGSWKKLLPLVEFAYNKNYHSNIKMASSEDLVIKDYLKATSNKKKPYAGLRRKDIEFQIGDKVFSKVSHWKKSMQLGRKGKLSPRLIGLYEVLERIGPMA
ncbi:reverse transcriptase [Gossypium australe]|uniref:Reverse transcriptase n=1 Tax=Gossypium australe TaxID=47621 RepID=A0A5B6VM76_9ROSI|nr:reverse transcriptase [Gossypium australe]